MYPRKKRFAVGADNIRPSHAPLNQPIFQGFATAPMKTKKIFTPVEVQ